MVQVVGKEKVPCYAPTAETWMIRFLNLAKTAADLQLEDGVNVFLAGIDLPVMSALKKNR